MKIDDPSFTRVWNVNLFCLIRFVPDKCVPNVNTRCPLPWHITEGSSNASSPLTEEEHFRESLLETVQVVIRCEKNARFWHATINYYAHNTISRVTDQARRREVKQENLTSGWHNTRCSGQRLLYAHTELSAITCQCHCPEITECWKLSAIWWWPRADREPGWHPSCAPRAAHRSTALNALTATRTRTDLATACCHGERN